MISFSHTNIIAKDWRKLAEFYINVFHCEFVPPERDIAGDWLSKGVGLVDAHIYGCHIRVPGFDNQGPTIEIFSYDEMEPQEFRKANLQGIRHIAFLTDDVEHYARKVVEHGGAMVGEIVKNQLHGVGVITFVYVADPEGNLIEIQSWN